MLIWSILLGLIVSQSRPCACLGSGRDSLRIAGGSVAVEYQFPYQVGLSIGTGNDLYTWCGGSLISDQWVLTAAHCVDNITSITYYLGAVQRLAPRLLLRTIEPLIHIHPAWHAESLENDIALLQLPQPIGFSEAIRPIKLPRMTKDYANYDYELATASGWGREDDATTTISNQLRYVMRYVDSNDDCELAYGRSVRPTNICMDTTGGRSTCTGDSGGPLMYFDQAQGAPILIGLTSFGKRVGCTLGYPAVFTRITAYLAWIAQVSGVANL